MLDLLLIPAALTLALALLAVRRGDQRLHGHLMAISATLVFLRLILHPRAMASHLAALWLLLGAVAGGTMLLGRAALAWREGRSRQPGLARLHRNAGAATLSLALLTLAAWLLRSR